MSILSEILLQFNQKKETIIINRESYKLFNKMNQYPVYFSTVNDDFKLDILSDPLRLKKIDHVFTKISKDLLDKFRIISISVPDYKLLISSILIANGFKNYEVLSSQIYNLLHIFTNNLKSMHIFSSMFEI
jgi:hypothetical protein